MEKIEFIQDNGYFIKEDLVKELQFEQCLEKQSLLSKFKALFKKKKITNWFDLEKEIRKFLDKYEIDVNRYPFLYHHSTFKLNNKITKKFIKKFSKYDSLDIKERFYTVQYNKNSAVINRCRFLFFENIIHIEIIK